MNENISHVDLNKILYFMMECLIHDFMRDDTFIKNCLQFFFSKILRIVFSWENSLLILSYLYIMGKNNMLVESIYYENIIRELNFVDHIIVEFYK